jgi:hypothetical protein
MSLVFHKASKIPDMAARNDQLTKLLRIFKKWEVLGFFPAHIMNQIADSNHLRLLVSLCFNLNYYINRRDNF